MYSKVFGRSRQILVNNFFDPRTPSMRKVDVGKAGEGGGDHASQHPERRPLVPIIELSSAKPSREVSW